MSKKQGNLLFNRELSWLEFNHRVLDEARDAANPLLERLKFLAITASNLDEFFMVRVGGLNMARKAGRRKRDASGLTPLMQLKAIDQRAHQMMDHLHKCYNDVVAPALEIAGLRRLDVDHLASEQGKVLFDLFSEQLFAVITPSPLYPERTFPLLQNHALHLLVHLRKKGRKKEHCTYAVLPLNRCGSRVINLASECGYGYALLEDVVRKYAPNWFPGYHILETAVFRITRNADFAVQESEAPDLLVGMEDVLEERKTGDCIRLEVEEQISGDLLKFLVRGLEVGPEAVYRIPGALNIKDFMSLVFIEGFDELKTDAWPPQASPGIVPNEPMFDQIARNDMLLYHPYESFSPVVRLIEEAAADEDTLAIKMVLYRTSSDSPIINALKTAAENGVSVTVLMELKARFDEARNIGWAREMEQSGVQVVYGVKGYKTHAKICLIVRRETSGIVRYCHFGTGNYNETTAKLYGDISYMTSNRDLGADASMFFNALCGYAQPGSFNLISMAPVNMRERIIELIDFEISRAQKGQKALIRVKVNSLFDVALTDKLYEASNAGVEVHLNIRGICGLKPRVKGQSENIVVSSIIDRYLEHARIIHFHHNGKPQVFIASADWMPRNLDKRLELIIPVEDRKCRDRLIAILDLHCSDNVNSWQLRPDGSYKRPVRKKNDPLRSQQVLYEQACEAIQNARKKQPTRFEPHKSCK